MKRMPPLKRDMEQHENDKWFNIIKPSLKVEGLPHLSSANLIESLVYDFL